MQQAPGLNLATARDYCPTNCLNRASGNTLLIPSFWRGVRSKWLDVFFLIVVGALCIAMKRKGRGAADGDGDEYKLRGMGCK